MLRSTCTVDTRQSLLSLVILICVFCQLDRLGKCSIWEGTRPLLQNTVFIADLVLCESLAKYICTRWWLYRCISGGTKGISIVASPLLTKTNYTYHGL